MRYIPCELHCHTIHSDGDFTPQSLQKAAVDDGLSLIALTDHNTLSGTNELDNGIIPFIKGIEWTTYFGHMLVLGAKKFVDWRDAVPDNIDEKIAAVRETGATVGVAHPFQCGSPICTGGRWEFNVTKWENVNYIEIWHEAFHDKNTENNRALPFWTSLLDKGYHLAASYGKDWHRPQSSDALFGCTYLGIDGEINEENAISAIKCGRMVVSTGAAFSFTVNQNDKDYNIGETLSAGSARFDFHCDFEARKNDRIKHDTIRIVTNGGQSAAEADKNTQSMKITLETGKWYRAELWGAIDGTQQPLAVTSPVYAE